MLDQCDMSDREFGGARMEPRFDLRRDLPVSPITGTGSAGDWLICSNRSNRSQWKRARLASEAAATTTVSNVP